jgi:hypothetical protein
VHNVHREEVEAFCTQLAFAEMGQCFDNEMGDQLDQIAVGISAVGDLRMVAASSGIRGGNDLVAILKRDDRNFVEWQIDLLSRYVDYISRGWVFRSKWFGHSPYAAVCSHQTV